MIEPDGKVTMLDRPSLPADAPKGAVLAFGNEADIKALGRRVRRDHARQKAKRKRQRQARRANR